MITVIYRIMLLILLIFIIKIMFKEEKITNQINAALVIIPLLLRVLMIK